MIVRLEKAQFPQVIYSLRKRVLVARKNTHIARKRKQTSTAEQSYRKVVDRDTATQEIVDPTK